MTSSCNLDRALLDVLDPNGRSFWNANGVTCQSRTNILSKHPAVLHRQRGSNLKRLPKQFFVSFLRDGWFIIGGQGEHSPKRFPTLTQVGAHMTRGQTTSAQKNPALARAWPRRISRTLVRSTSSLADASSAGRSFPSPMISPRPRARCCSASSWFCLREGYRHRSS